MTDKKKELRITMVQADLIWEKQEQNRDRFESVIDNLESKTDLIVLPEMFTTGFSMQIERLSETMDGPTIYWMKKNAAKSNSHITGSIIIRENESFYNRLLWATPEGEVFYYDKKHLFRMADEHNYYTAGKKKLIVDVKGWKICPMICYDLRFPVWIRNKSDYDLLIFIANWPEIRNEIFTSLLKARAIENLAYVVGVNRVGSDGNKISYSGNSALYDYTGTAISRIPSHEEAVETVSLDRTNLDNFREKFQAWRDADDFTLL